MNRVFKVIWSEVQQAWIAVGEHGKTKGKSKQTTKAAVGAIASPLSGLLIVSSLVLATLPVHAVNTTWTGATSTDWATASNWDTGNVPTSSDQVFLGALTPTTTDITTAVNPAQTQIGGATGETGTVTVNGGSASLTSSSSFYVGGSGIGNLTISNGAMVNNGQGFIGSSQVGIGTVVVDGNGSTWANSSLQVGKSGTGNLTISNGATVSNSSGYIGYFAAGNGTVVVDGNGTSWINSSSLMVGKAGTGNLTISNGAVVSNTDGFIAESDAGSTGMVVVQDNGSSWTNSGNLDVGRRGTGSLMISKGANVVAGSGSGTLNIGKYSGSNGTLTIGAAQGDAAVAAGTLNAATVVFGSGVGKLVFNHTDSAYEFAPDIESGSGSSSIELYSGTTRFTGDLSAFNRTLSNDGGTLSVASGDTLTLSKYTQTSNGTFKVGVTNDTTYGKLVVTGTATLPSNAKIDVDVSDPNFSFSSTTLQDIISAGTLVSDGTFDVTDDSLLFKFDAVKDGDTVDLTLTLVDSGSDNNSDSNSSDSTGIIETAANNTGNNPVAPVAKVLDQLSAIYVNNGLTTGNDDIDALIEAVGSIATETEVAEAVAQTLPMLVAGTAPIASGTLHATSRVVQARQSSFTGASSGDFMLADKHLWVKPVGNWTEQNKRNGVSGYKADSYGLVGGIDGDLNDSTKLGFAVSYMNTDVKGKGTASHNTADIDAYQAIVYGSHALASNLELNWQADVGINKNDGTRQIVIGALSRIANADYNSYTAHIGTGIGKSFALNDKTTVVPSIRADYAYIKDESYSETGSAGDIGLNVGGSNSDELIVMAQSSLSHELNDKATLIANVGLGYDLINDQTSLTASYIGGGAAFTTKGIDPSPWIGSAGAGVNYNISDTSEITARYDVEGRSDFLSQTASVKFRWLF